MGDVVVAIGTAGVIRRAGELLLTDDVTGGSGTVLRATNPFSLTQAADGRCVLGGLAPAGAVTVEVRADDGAVLASALAGGAWVAESVGRARPHRPVLLWRDADGSVVRPTLPTGWRREPVVDVPVRCPACDAADWEVVTPDDPGARGGWEDDDGVEHAIPVVVCVRCGHEEAQVGSVVFSAVEDDEEPSPAERRRAERWSAAERRRRTRALEAIDFPILRIAGAGAVALAGYAGGGRGTDQVTVRCGEVELESTREDDGDHDRLWRALEHLVHVARHRSRTTWPVDPSAPVAALLMAAEDRAARVAAAESRTVAVVMRRAGRDPLTAEGRANAAGWAVQARWDDVHLLASGTGVVPGELELDEIADRGALDTDDAWG